MYSIALPLLFMIGGGIGLPGAAVYINPQAIPAKQMRSLTSAAGPASTAVCALILAIPFLARWVDLDQEAHLAFWSGFALLAFLHVSGLFLNLLPLPGLDGFGIIEPFLPERIVTSVRNYGSYSTLLLFAFFYADTPISQGFWNAVRFFCSLVNLDWDLVLSGLDLFRFWAL